MKRIGGNPGDSIRVRAMTSLAASARETSVTLATNATIACFAAPSFQEDKAVGRWLIGANGRANAQRDENKEKRDEIRHPSHFWRPKVFEIFNSKKLRTWFDRNATARD